MVSGKCGSETERLCGVCRHLEEDRVRKRPRLTWVGKNGLEMVRRKGRANFIWKRLDNFIRISLSGTTM